MKRFVFLAALLLLSVVSCTPHKTVIAQVSDTQFGFRDDNVIDYEVGTYSKCVEELNELQPDVVVLTGDLVNHPWVKPQWKALEEITARLDKDIQVLYIPGNHDVVLEEGKLDMDAYYEHLDYTRFAEVVGDTYLIGLDSNPIKDCYGSEEEEEQFEWLEKVLEENKKHRTPIVFTHHPFFLEDFDEDEGYFQLCKEARKKYFDLFEKYGVKAVFSGHLHQNRVAAYKESMPVVTTSAIGVPLGKDKSGYRIITVEDGKLSHEYIDVDMDN